MRKGHLATKNRTTNSRQMFFPHYKILRKSYLYQYQKMTNILQI
jgi:hypothetical protein